MFSGVPNGLLRLSPPQVHAAVHNSGYISANTDDLFKASFLADGTADGVPAFVDHISDNTEMYGFGDIVITDAGILGASAARTATGGEQGSCANAGAADPIEVLLSYVLPAGPLVELKTCDAEPIMSLGFGGEGTLFGNVSTGDPANEIYLVDLANGERRLIHDDAAPPAGYSDWADGPTLCECDRCDEDDDEEQVASLSIAGFNSEEEDNRFGVCEDEDDDE